MGHIPTSVVVVTGLDAKGVPHGITIGSFVSVSLDPPLVGFLPGVSSRSWSAIAESGRFCVNVLASDQEEICWRFAKESDDKFAGVAWSPAPGGGPLIDGCVAWIDCAVESETAAGDHWFVVGRVEAMDTAPGATDAMVFFRGKVTGVDAGA